MVSGDWEVPSNWSTGVVPGPEDNVGIDVPGLPITITHSSGTTVVRSLHCSEHLRVLGGAIESQQIYSWCIPIYYGETKDYFILTSPCFINGGNFTEQADSSIVDLQNALNTVITKKNYDFIGN
jgi:hypothetical protein